VSLLHLRKWECSKAICMQGTHLPTFLCTEFVGVTSGSEVSERKKSGYGGRPTCALWTFPPLRPSRFHALPCASSGPVTEMGQSKKKKKKKRKRARTPPEGIAHRPSSSLGDSGESCD